MAEGGNTSHGHTSDSDIIFDLQCDVCRDYGLNVEALGYCTDCDEYLCDSCCKIHTRTRLTRNHALLDKASMPKNTKRVNKIIQTTCELHPTKLVEFYCRSDDKFGCSTCFMSTHKNCSDVETIEEKSAGILESKEFTEFMALLEHLDQRSRAVIEKSRSNLEQARACHTETLRSVRQLREQFMATWDNLEADIIKEADRLMSEQEKKMDSLSKTCSSVQEGLEKLRTEFDCLQSSQRICEIYIALKKHGNVFCDLQWCVLFAELDTKPVIFKFEPDARLQKITDGLKKLGKIVVGFQASGFSPLKSVSTSSVRATHLADIDMRLQQSCTGIMTNLLNVGSTSHISGMVSLPNNQIVLNDNNNGNIYLVDTSNFSFISKLNVDGSPWDVTAVDENKVAVTIPRRQKILLLGVSETLEKKREITVRGQCYGVSHYCRRLLVTVGGHDSNWRLEIMDLNGDVVQTIETDRNGRRLFTCPGYVCVINNRKSIYMYVPDAGSHKVTAFALDGEVKTKCRLQYPRGMCVDHQDNVFVCDGTCRAVYMLTADLSNIKVIISPKDGLDSSVLSVCHCRQTNRLFVGMENNIVKVFQLS